MGPVSELDTKAAAPRAVWMHDRNARAVVAFASTDGGRASAVAFVGDDLYAVDIVADRTDSSEADLRELCLALLDLALD